MRPFTDAAVARTFTDYPPLVRRRMLALRALILATAARTPGVGALEESLKWGEPAYRPAARGTGTTLRLGWTPRIPARYALLVHCRTNLVATFRREFPDTFTFVGTRAIVFDVATAPPRSALATCIAHALTYHRRPHPPSRL